MRIGIDLGGTKIEGIVLDSSAGAPSVEITRKRVETPAGDYSATIAAITALIDDLESEAGAPAPLPIGIGIPGTVSPATGLVKNANSTCLIGKPFDADLQSALSRPVKLANDADCFTVSEARDGAGADHHVVFGVILGTGVGGGIAIGGDLLAGPNAIAGEWGHNPLPAPQTLDGQNEVPGPRCYCGRRGCIETFLSGPGLTRDTMTANGVRGAAANEDLTAEDVVQRAVAGDPSAQAALHRYENRLARALAGVINILDPGVIVLGGGLSNLGRLYQNVPKLWAQWVFSDRVDTSLVKNRHGDSSGVRGAAWLWPEVGTDAE